MYIHVQVYMYMKCVLGRYILTNYLDPAENSSVGADTLSVDGRFSHTHQIQIRLDFVRYIHNENHGHVYIK